MSPSAAAVLILGESYGISRARSSLSSRTLCCSHPGRLALLMSPLRAYIEFLISLRLSPPLGSKQMLLNWLNSAFKCHHRWVRIEGFGTAKARQQIGLIWQQASPLVIADSISRFTVETYLGCRVIRVSGEIYTRKQYVLPVHLMPLTYILRTCSLQVLNLYFVVASRLLQHEDNAGALQIRRDSRSSRRALCHGRWKLLFALSRFLWMYDMRLARLMVVL